MKFFHGTSAENAQNIIENGWNSKRLYPSTWSCSADNRIYLVSSAREGCYFLAVEEGQITAAKNGSTSKDIYVFEFDIPEDVADEYLLKDNSCEGMEHCYSIDAAILDNLLMALDIKMCFRSYPVYIPMMRPFYLTSLSDKYMKITDLDLMEAVKMANSIYSGEHFLELSSDIICEHISYDEGYDEDNEWSKD